MNTLKTTTSKQTCKEFHKISKLVCEIRLNLQTSFRKDKTEYPVDTLREAILNAVIHRDYSIHTEVTTVQINFFTNCVEIHSPGSLYGRLSIEDLGKTRPDLRNPALAVMTESITAAP